MLAKLFVGLINANSNNYSKAIGQLFGLIDAQ